MKERVFEYSFSDALKFIGRLVEVQHLHKIPATKGIVALVDPESLSLLLATSSGTRLVIPFSILAIDEVNDPEKLEEFQLIVQNYRVLKNQISENELADCSQSEKILGEEALKNRREQLLVSLGKQHLPFKEESADVIKVLNCVEVHSPFTAATCFSANEIILSKVRKLVSEL